MACLSEHLSRLARVVTFACSGLLLAMASATAQEPDVRAAPPDLVVQSSPQMRCPCSSV